MLSKLLAFIVGLLFCSYGLKAQVYGCRDIQATNYNPSATINDGSCVYPVTNVPIDTSMDLAAIVKESSALQKDPSTSTQFWTINDGSNSPQLFLLDTWGNVIRKVWVKNQVNTDWEALAQSNTHLFIGDFGNNNGNRKNLKVLKILWSAIHSTDTVSADTIGFYYPEQTDFTSSPDNTAFDAEAFFYSNDSLYLFTKNWKTLQSSQYVLPSTKGYYPAKLRSTYAVDGLISDATYDTASKVAMLLGYKDIGLGIYTCFSYLLFDYQNDDFFSGNKRRVELGGPSTLGQTEGISFVNDFNVAISGEAIKKAAWGIDWPARLSKFSVKPYLVHYLSLPQYSIHSLQNNFWPNPVQDQLFINSKGENIPFRIFNSEGKCVLEGRTDKAYINVSSLKAGHYYLHLNKIIPIHWIKE